MLLTCCIRCHFFGYILVQSFKSDTINNLDLSMKACGVNAPFSLLLLRSSSQSQGELIYQYLRHLFFSLSFPWESRGQRGEARAPVKWLYRGETCAGGGPRLKAEWQAAEAIKIEPLSLAARTLLIRMGAQASRVSHTHSQTHTPSILWYLN